MLVNIINALGWVLMVYISIAAGFNTPEHNSLWRNIIHYERIVMVFFVSLFMIALK